MVMANCVRCWKVCQQNNSGALQRDLAVSRENENKKQRERQTVLVN